MNPSILGKLKVGMRVRIRDAAPYSIHILGEIDELLATKLSPEAAAIHTITEVGSDYSRSDWTTIAENPNE